MSEGDGVDPGAPRPPRARRPRAPRTCFDRALKLLSLRDHATAELRRKLGAAGHEATEIAAALERLAALGYLDDARFARERARQLCASGRLGRAAIAARLQQAGVAAELVRRALDEQLEGRDELAAARALLARRFPALAAPGDQKERARAARFLAGRGFSAEVIGRLLHLLDGES